MTICICGSKKFKDAMTAIAADMEAQGNIVLLPYWIEDTEEKPASIEDKLRVDNTHRQKVELADVVFVVNIDNYIGESTFGQVDWAYRKGKNVQFLVEPPKPESEETKTTEGEVVSE